MRLGRKATPPSPAGRQRPSRLTNKKPTAFSYYSRRSDESVATGRQMARTETAAKTLEISRFWRQRFGLGILLVSGLLCLVYVTTLTAQPRIALTPGAEAAGLQPVAVYEATIQEYMASSVFHRNKITLGTVKLSEHLTGKYPELAAAQISLPLLTHRVQIQLTPARPILILATASGSYAIDNRGMALASGTRLADLSELNLPLVTDDSNLAVDLRKQALPAANARFIAGVAAYLAADNITIASMSLPAGSSELHVRPAGVPYYIKFNLADDKSRQQAGTYIAVQERLKEQGITPGEYIDVRVNNRAYYK